jgi:hypothetical protein
MDLLSFLPASLLGFIAFKYISHPQHKLSHFRPKIGFWRLEVSPHVRLFISGRVVHLHHWINLSLVLTITLIINAGVLDLAVVKGAMVGGILQGLTFPDKLHIIYPDTLSSSSPIQANMTSTSSTTGALNDTV